MTEWRCFHCGDLFTDRAAAAEHFGDSLQGDPACKLNAVEGGLLKLVRAQEDELQRYRTEDSASCREFYKLGTEHFQAVQRAEEQGYARGLADAAKVAQLSFQKRVLNWLMECFSMEVCRDRQERNHRFLEEALELVQALDCTRNEAHQLVDYVFDRPCGDPAQELGGVQVTLAALCFPNDLDMEQAAERELARVWVKIDAVRAKQATKPGHSPLPGVATA